MFNPVDMDGKRFLVTGATSGIGRATALYLSRLGAEIVASGRNAERLRETLSQLAGDVHHGEAFDLSASKDIPQWIKSVALEHGPLDGLVHCAGVQFTLPVQATAIDKFEKLMQTNVTSGFALAKGFQQRSVHAESSSLVFLSSVMALVGQAGVSSYCCSKGALLSLARSLALEFSHKGIRVNCIAPGLVKTEMADKFFANLTDEQKETVENMHPLGIGTPDDIAAAVAFLLSDMGKWITGTCLTVDGGYTAH